MKRFWLAALPGLFLSTADVQAQKEFPPDPPMPAVVLPDALKLANGQIVTTAEDWAQKRRPEVLELFRKHVYGRIPATPYKVRYEVTAEDPKALDGQATLKQVTAYVTAGDKTHPIRFAYFIPNAAKGPVPAFLLICNRPVENIDVSRKVKSEFWPVEVGIARGFAMVAYFYEEVTLDKAGNFDKNIPGLLEPQRQPDSWASLAMWGWGASRILDHLLTDPKIDGKKVAVIGHSRGGKTALWAGAEDTRFSLVISNNSGCGGAAISRRKFTGKEQVARINTAFPHWFADNFKQFNDKENDLPIDQHMLIGLIAPRAVAVGSALDDKWADPRGEFLATAEADKVYALFGKKGLGRKDMPNIGEAAHGDGSHYHIREGKHNLLLEDWKHYFDFAARTWK